MRVMTLFLLLALAACQSSGQVAPPIAIVTPKPAQFPTPSEALAKGLPLMSPSEAVVAAAEAALRRGGVRAVFAVPVRRTEQVGARYFLNSEADYRDQRNLSVVIHPVALSAVRARFGDNLSQAFLGRSIRLYGRAERVRIDFTANGRPTGKYYYQTHVTVFDPRQIEVVS